MKPGDINIIVAMTEQRVIGCNGKLPWHLPEDLQLFKRMTIGGTVIMGRKTYESIGGALPDRDNLVVSSRQLPGAGFEICPTLSQAVSRARQLGHKIFCIGGEQLFHEALPLATYLHISWVDGDYEGDTFFPEFDLGNWQETARQRFDNFTHVTYKRKKGQD